MISGLICLIAIVILIFSVVTIPERLDRLKESLKSLEKRIDEISKSLEHLSSVQSRLTGDKEYDEDDVALGIRKDDLLFEVAKWAIECGKELSTSAVQQHFSVGYSRAYKIVNQLYGLGLCTRCPDNSNHHVILINMEELMQLERKGVFRGCFAMDLSSECEEDVAMSEKKDKLLFEVAKWAIECGNGLSISAVQRHFSIGYSRAGKIVDQLFGLGLCTRSAGNSKPRAMLIDMDKLMQLQRSGAFRNDLEEKVQNEGVNPEIERLEQELREKGSHMSAIQIREIRDKIAEIRRAYEEINREKECQDNMMVKKSVCGGDDREA